MRLEYSGFNALEKNIRLTGTNLDRGTSKFTCSTRHWFAHTNTNLFLDLVKGQLIQTRIKNVDSLNGVNMENSGKKATADDIFQLSFSLSHDLVHNKASLTANKLASLVALLLLTLSSKRLVDLSQMISVFLVGRLLEHGLLPQVGRQVSVRASDGCIRRFR